MVSLPPFAWIRALALSFGTKADAVCTVKGSVVFETATTVDSSTLDNVLKLDGVVAEVATNSGTGNSADHRDQVNALTAVDAAAAEHGATDIHGVVATIALNKAVRDGGRQNDRIVAVSEVAVVALPP